MKKQNNKGFSLAELLVVIIIIAVLASVLVTTISSLKAHANKAKCKANLKSLAQGVITKTADGNGHTMFASSFVVWYIDAMTGEKKWDVRNGWISWLDANGRRPIKRNWGSESFNRATTYVGAGVKDGRKAIMEGEMWGFDDRDGNPPRPGYINKNLSVFLCPSHKNAKVGNYPVCRSYAMNAYFGYSLLTNGKAENLSDGWAIGEQHKLQNVAEPMRVMLFAEILPGLKTNNPLKFTQSDDAGDSVLVPWQNRPNDHGRQTLESFLNTSTGAPKESINFSHKSQGKNYGHVAFLDGHVVEVPEKYVDPITKKESNPTLRAAVGLY